MKNLSREALEAIIPFIPTGVVVVEKANGEITYVNEKAISLYGVDPRGLQLPEHSTKLIKLLTLSGEIYPPEQLPASKALLTGEEAKDELIIERPDGTRVIVEASATPIKDENGQVIAAVGIFDDVTERKSAEKSAMFQAQLLNLVGESVIVTNGEGAVIYWNQAAEDMYGWTRSEALGRYVVDLTVPNMSQKDANEIFQRLTMGQHWEGEYKVSRRDGTEFYIWAHDTPMLDKNGKISAIIGVSIDITERKKAEDHAQQLLSTIQQERDRLSSLLNSMTDEVWFADTQKNITLANPSAIKEFMLDSLGTDAVENIAASFKVYRADGSPRPVDEAPPLRSLKGEVIRNEVELVKTPNRPELRYRQVSAAPVKDRDGKIIGSISVVRDITELTQLQNRLQKNNVELERLVEERTKQLKDSERLAAIGATAGMVGHDIRNPLQAITSDVYLAKTELAYTPDSDEKKNTLESLTEIEKNIEYINKIVADLQDFARPINPVAKETDLENLCQDVLLKSNLPKNIYASCKVDKEAKQVIADPDLLKRVISNLVTNAGQAMPEGGNLSIIAYRKEGELFIEVQDTGVGIPDDVKFKLFTPMFTTKSKGQGFGLAVVKRITEAMNGTVSFESERGRGTKFILRFPPPKKKR